jgi:3D (Asp-Asp-Asp) domain-containing protein
LPFGTRVKFPDYYGDRIFIVEDRTARRFSNRADIWMETRGQALQWGIKNGVRMVVVN